MAKFIVINRNNGTVTIVRKELETTSEDPLTEHELIIVELYEQLKLTSVSISEVADCVHSKYHMEVMPVIICTNCNDLLGKQSDC